jgi:hypothetical protein
MKKIHLVAAVAAGLLAVLSAAQQQSFAQYGDAVTPGVTEEMLQKCVDLKIERSQCNDSTILLKERLGGEEGSGTALIAEEAEQMIALIGVLGAVFGGIAGAFFVMGRTKQAKPA